MFRSEWFKIFHNKQLLVGFILVALLPAIYGVIFIGSMWNPYGKIDHLPVAIVNLDQPVSNVKVGDQLVTGLKKTKALDYHFVSQKTADKGLKNGDYFMTMVLPKTLSKQVTELGTSYAKPINLSYTLSTGRNYVASKMVTSAAGAIQVQLNQTITTSAMTALLTKIEQSQAEQAKVLSSGIPYAEYQAFAGPTPQLPSAKSLIDPVKLVRHDISPVPNNGTAITPYMLSVSLWTGAIVLTNLFSLRKFKRRGNAFDMWFSKFGVLIPAGILQGLGILFALDRVWHFHQKEILATILILFLTSLVYLSLIGLLNMLFNQFGTVIALVFMFLQLSVSAGTYPLKLTSPFYQTVHPWVPMTYAVDGLRHTISIGGLPTNDVLVLSGFAIIFTILIIVMYAFKGNKFVVQPTQ
ncbi:MAG: YhgE/Pip family protein [Lactobacillaceae bacterium]|jgi:YhgE/Pip-like protein|nr:YhgE/Pip family protein [Lactobacillaceae bacterium]